MAGVAAWRAIGFWITAPLTPPNAGSALLARIIHERAVNDPGLPEGMAKFPRDPMMYRGWLYTALCRNSRPSSYPFREPKHKASL